MSKHAHKDKPMIPYIWVRDALQEVLPMLAAYVTQNVLNLKRGVTPQVQLYKHLITNGFNNEYFKSLFQLASDYYDYLRHEKLLEQEHAFKESARKACELYTAIYIKDNQLFSTLPSGTRNFYESLANECPELLKKIEAHHRQYDGIKGEEHVYPQQQIVPGQIYQDQMGNLFTYDQMGRQVAMPQQPMQVPPEIRHAQSMMRRNNSQYAPTTPQQTMGWGANPQYQQPTQYQQPPQLAQPRSAYNNPGDNYNNYSNQQPQSGGLMTAYTPQPTQVPVQQHHQLNSSHEIGAPTATKDWYDTSNARQVKTEAYKPQVQPDPAPVIDSLTKPASGRKYTPTDNGFKTDYYWVEPDEWSLNVLGYPIIYDATATRAVYKLNKNKVIQELVFTTGGDSMDFDVHENIQLIKKEQRKSKGPDKEATLKMLAEIQRKNFIEEKLNEIMGEAVEGNVTGDTEVDLNSPVILTTLLTGSTPPSDFIYVLKNAVANTKYETLYSKLVFNFEYQHINPITLFGDQADVVRKLSNLTDWIKIRNTLSELADLDVEPTMTTQINDMLTVSVNNTLNYRLGIDLKIDSFDLDIEDLIDTLDEDYNGSTDFKRCAKRVAQSVLKVVGPDSDSYKQAFGEDASNAARNEVVFVINYDVTTLPMHSDDIFIPIPCDVQMDGAEFTLRSQQAIVTQASFPALYTVVADRMRNTSPDISHVLLVTNNGVVLSIHSAGLSSMYIIEKM